MLNYNDAEETLLQFYRVNDLHLPVIHSPPTSSSYSDSSTNEDQSIAEQLSTLNELLQAENAFSGSNHMAHDFKDPLNGENVAQKLIDRGVVQSKADSLLQKFLVSSRDFNPQAYLSVVHKNTSIDQLHSSLSTLDSEIRHQTSRLKAVMDENFEDFLMSKKAIDEVLVSFRESKSRAQKQAEKSKVFNPSTKRDNIKRESSETLLSELEESINNLNLSSSLMIRPVMDHNSKQVKITKLLEFVSKNRFMFDSPGKLIDYLSHHDDNNFINDYQRFIKEREVINTRQQRAYDRAKQSDDEMAIKELERSHALENTVLNKVSSEVAKIAHEYRQRCLEDLLSTDHEVGKKNYQKSELNVKFISLVDRLHRMRIDDSNIAPISHFLRSQLTKIESELSYECGKFETRFVAMQTKLQEYINSLSSQRLNGSHVSHIAEKFESVEEYFRASSAYNTSELDSERESIVFEIFGNNENLDLSIINETWLVLANFIAYIEEYFRCSVSKFVKNYVHYSQSEGKANLDNNGQLQAKFFHIIGNIIGKIMRIFDSGKQTDQLKVTPSNYGAFLPYHTNSLSTIFYLGLISTKFNRLLTKLGIYTAQIGSSTQSLSTNKYIKSLRETSTAFDQKILESICATWVNDCSQFYDLENWVKYNVGGHRNDNTIIYTKLIQIMYYFEVYVLESLSRLLIRKGDTSNGAVRIVSPYPSKRILISLEIQFMRSMNVLVDSSVKKFTAEKAAVSDGKNLHYETEKCIYKILTMNNFTALGEYIFPKLLQKFDQLFENTLSKQTLKLFVDLDKVKITILDDINEIEKAWIEGKIDKHFRSVEDSKITRGVDVDPFVYDCLLHFVKLLHVLKPITDGNTFIAIIQQLQNHFLSKFLQCVRVVTEKERIIVRILANIKLDLDFFVEVFEASEYLRLNDFCLNLVQVILAHVQKTESIFTDLPYTPQEIDQKLYKALEYSKSEFACFL